MYLQVQAVSRCLLPLRAANVSVTGVSGTSALNTVVTESDGILRYLVLTLLGQSAQLPYLQICQYLLQGVSGTGAVGRTVRKGWY